LAIMIIKPRTRSRCPCPSLWGLASLALGFLLLLALESQASENTTALELSCSPGSFPNEYNCTPLNSSISHDPLSSIEDLLRGQATLYASFESLLRRTNTTLQEKIDFLHSFEDLLRRQTVLYSGFEALLKLEWFNMDCNGQKKFLASYEDLLHRETFLFASFENLSQECWEDLPREEQVKLLQSYEDLLRRQTELFKATHGGLTIEKSVDKKCVNPGECVNYTYTVRNWYKKAVKNVTIVDDQLGLIADNTMLGPGEIKTFSRKIAVNCCICNLAKIYGTGPCGELLYDESNMVCIEIIRVGLNRDRITTGDQRTYAIGTDPPKSSNFIEIKKNQKSALSESQMLYNIEDVRLGDQTSFGISTGTSSNTIKIVTNQE
jgi:uncharacterized repeat protein (TIGR01451 family)